MAFKIGIYDLFEHFWAILNLKCLIILEQRLKNAEKLRLEEKRKLETEQELKINETEKINLKVEKKLDEQKKDRLSGEVKWFNGAKGYGFIKREDKKKDIFVHFSAVKKAGLKYLREGEQITFEVENTDRGLAAVNLQKKA